MKRFALPAISLAAFIASGIAVAQTTPGQMPTTPDQAAPDASAASSVTIDASKAMLATRLIGSSVYTSADENVGDINDLIFDNTGTIQAVVVGIGGFLGMGEKDIAMPLDKLNVTRDENNVIKLTVAASRDELDKAPAFDKTLFMVKTPKPDTTLPTSPGGSGTTNQ